MAELESLVGRANNTTEAAGSANNNKDEALLAINLLVQFFFRELRSQGAVRRFLLRRINQEMEEVLSRGAVSKIIKGLKVSDDVLVVVVVRTTRSNNKQTAMGLIILITFPIMAAAFHRFTTLKWDQELHPFNESESMRSVWTTTRNKLNRSISV